MNLKLMLIVCNLYDNCITEGAVQLNVTKDQFEEMLEENDQLYAPFCANKPCGENSVCINKRLTRYCRCKCGHTGNPYIGCHPYPQAQAATRAMTRIEVKVIVEEAVPSWVTEEYLEVLVRYAAGELTVPDIFQNESIVVPSSTFITNITYVNAYEQKI